MQFLDVSTMHLKVHVYRLHDDGPVSEELDEDCDVSAANHWILPSSEWTLVTFDPKYVNVPALYPDSSQISMIHMYMYLDGIILLQYLHSEIYHMCVLEGRGT